MEEHFSCSKRTDFKASAVQSATTQPQSSVLKEKPPCRAWGHAEGRGGYSPTPIGRQAWCHLQVSLQVGTSGAAGTLLRGPSAGALIQAANTCVLLSESISKACVQNRVWRCGRPVAPPPHGAQFLGQGSPGAPEDPTPFVCHVRAGSPRTLQKGPQTRPG